MSIFLTVWCFMLSYTMYQVIFSATVSAIFLCGCSHHNNALSLLTLDCCLLLSLRYKMPQFSALFIIFFHTEISKYYLWRGPLPRPVQVASFYVFLLLCFCFHFSFYGQFNTVVSVPGRFCPARVLCY